MTSRAGGAGQFFRDVHGRVTDAVTRFTDPREKQIRRTRKARRRSVRLGTGSGITATGTMGLAAASAPDWTIIAGGGATALLAVPAVMAWQRFRVYRSQPLPPVRPARRFHPGYTSAAYDSMLRLGDAEQSLYRMLTVLSRAEVVPHADLEEISVASAAAGDALEATARDIVEMEHAQRALRGSGQRRGRAGNGASGAQHDLRVPISALADQVSDGVEEIEALALAASQMTEAAFDPSRPAQPGGRSLEAMDRRRAELLDAADRLEGLAHGLRELNSLGEPTSGAPMAARGPRSERIDPLAAPNPSIAQSTRIDPGRARPRRSDEHPWRTA
ncbi:hypothetical protein HT102_02815 [Hoyosella sp. G463]|uniref:Uncharacterized protein n=1 Tax=Lolliginicoccus lacisalsi TaxID=2742202 RepID=A0A927J9Z6_9ACTN|nr:hypothetical protein [Lolliginicoccus lacisalsi]MBD8505421.1 hypothetical protein [Lolliginicoccus lacisalsi]